MTNQHKTWNTKNNLKSKGQKNTKIFGKSISLKNYFGKTEIILDTIYFMVSKLKMQ